MFGWNQKPPEFHFDGSYAYTEDFVLIYNLVIYSISEGVDANFVQTYTLTKYGRVRECRVFSDPITHKPKIGYIDLIDPKDAALMLRTFQHYHRGKGFFVRPQFSWQQPNPELAVHSPLGANIQSEDQKHVQNDRGEAAEKNDDSSPHLNQLNLLNVCDDCLELILDFLPLVDKIQFARTCKRFLEVFKNRAFYKYRTLSLSDLKNLTLWQKRDFINFCGDFVEKVKFEGGKFHWHYNYVSLLNCVLMGCSNVRILTLRWTQFRREYVTKLWHIGSKIRELNLEACNLDDNCLEYIDCLKQLEVLKLNASKGLSGQHLNKVSSSLKELYLVNCRDIQADKLRSALENMKNLTVLDVRGLTCLTKKVFEDVTRNCRNLEKLSVPCNEREFESIVRLPCIKELLLGRSSTGTWNISMEFLNNLVKNHSENLEMLRVDGRAIISSAGAEVIGNLRNLKKLFLIGNDSLNDACMLGFKKLLNLEELKLKFCTEFSINGLLHLLMSCKKLKYLNIEGCSQITKDAIPEIIVLLKNQFKVEEQEQKLYLLLPESVNDDIDIEIFLSNYDYESVLKIVQKSEADNYGECFRQSKYLECVIQNYEYHDDYPAFEWSDEDS